MGSLGNTAVDSNKGQKMDPSRTAAEQVCRCYRLRLTDFAALQAWHRKKRIVEKGHKIHRHCTMVVLVSG